MYEVLCCVPGPAYTHATILLTMDSYGRPVHSNQLLCDLSSICPEINMLKQVDLDVITTSVVHHFMMHCILFMLYYIMISRVYDYKRV